MNWNSHSVDAVSKERIWREHVINEKNTARIHEEFRCNPLKKDPPTAESISKRPARFLDKTAVIMDMLQKRLQRAKARNGGGDDYDDDDGDRYLQMMSGRSNNSINLQQMLTSSGRSKIQQDFQLQSRGIYSSSNDKNKNTTTTTTTASGAVQNQTARGMNAKDKLPPIIAGQAKKTNNNNNNNNNETATTLTSTTATSNTLNITSSPRTKKILAVHDFDGLYSQAQLTPREKFAVPQTAMQEIGWWNQNLVSPREQEPRFRYGLSSCDVTKNGSAFVGSRKN